MDLLLSSLPSPIGTVLLVFDGDVLCALKFQDHEDRLHRHLRRSFGAYSLRPTSDTGSIGTSLGGRHGRSIPIWGRGPAARRWHRQVVV